MEMQILTAELDHKITLAKKKETDFNYCKNKLQNFFCSLDLFNSFLKSLKNSVRRQERVGDRKRQEKLRKLIRSREEDRPKNKAEVINFTSLEIPDSVKKALEFGHTRGISSPPSDISNYLAIESLFKEFQTEARKNEIPETEIEILRSHCVLLGQELRSCYSNDSHGKAISQFLRKNQDVVILNVDKSVNTCIISRSEYHQKLKDLFLNDPNFELSKRLKVKQGVKAYRNYLRQKTIGENFTHDTLEYQLKPNTSISDMYGLIK